MSKQTFMKLDHLLPCDNGEMVDVKINSQIPKALEILKTVNEKQWPFLVSYAANQTAKALVPYLREQMPKYIDRPKPFTLNSLWARYGNKNKPEATVEWRMDAGKGTPAGKYLKPIVEGGARPQKRFESALTRAGLLPSGWVLIPTPALPKDQYGNVSGGGAFFTRILSALRANPDAMQNRRISKLARKSTGKLIKEYYKGFKDRAKIAKREERAKARAMRYVIFGPNNNNNLPPGLYERSTTLGGKQNSTLRRIFVMQPSAAYRRAFPFASLLTTKAKDLFPTFITEALEKYAPKK